MMELNEKLGAEPKVVKSKGKCSKESCKGKKVNEACSNKKKCKK